MGRTSPKCNTRDIPRTILVMLLWLTSFLAGPAISKELLIDRMIAEVNGEPVVYSDVIKKVKNGPLVEVSPYPGGWSGL